MSDFDEARAREIVAELVAKTNGGPILPRDVEAAIRAYAASHPAAEQGGGLCPKLSESPFPWPGLPCVLPAGHASCCAVNPAAVLACMAAEKAGRAAGEASCGRAEGEAEVAALRAEVARLSAETRTLRNLAVVEAEKMERITAQLAAREGEVEAMWEMEGKARVAVAHGSDWDLYHLRMAIARLDAARGGK